MLFISNSLSPVYDGFVVLLTFPMPYASGPYLASPKRKNGKGKRKKKKQKHKPSALRLFSETSFLVHA